MKAIISFLFYLLILLLPTQLGRHFFFDFSLIRGVRSDYLAPTVYLTDIIIGLMIGMELVSSIKMSFRAKSRNLPRLWCGRSPASAGHRLSGVPKRDSVGMTDNTKPVCFYLLSVICYLLFTSIFIATNKWAALYKLVKIIEFIFLGLIIYELKPKILTISKIFAFTTIYVSLIAIAQFILQRSIGGVFWWLGERTFYAGTSGIAAIAFRGQLLLRPYATFPHPNVLGGFLTIVLPLFLYILLYQRKFIHRLFVILFWASLILGMISLFLSFSRAAWAVTIIGFLSTILVEKGKLIYWLKKHVAVSLLVFYTFIFLSIAIPLVLPVSGQSFMERVELIKAAIDMTLNNLFLGVGLNNFIVHLFSSFSSVVSLLISQPVHNIYLLTFVETGIVGFLFLLVFLAAVYYHGLSSHPLVVFALIQLLFLGFFDHYLFTLQQGKLLFIVFASLCLCRCYNDQVYK